MSKPRQIVYPDGTVRHVYAGPEATRWQRASHYLRQLAGWTVDAVALLAGVIGGAVLALEYDTLSNASRLWCGGALLGVLAVYALVRFRRQRRVRN